MSDYNNLINAAILTPPTSTDLGSDTNRYDNIFLDGNVNVGGTVLVSTQILPTTSNTIDIGSSTMRFGKLYLAGNTIDLGGVTISADAAGALQFTTGAGNIDITANTVSFLNTVANTETGPGNLVISNSITTETVYTNGLYWSGNGVAISTGGSSAVYTKTYYWKGGLTPNIGTVRYYVVVPGASATLNTINAYLATPGNTQSTVVVEKNGVPVNTIIFAASASVNLQSELTIPIVTSDYLTVDITQGGGGAADLYINFIYS
jgi:hypothetical protein